MTYSRQGAQSARVAFVPSAYVPGPVGLTGSGGNSGGGQLVTVASGAPSVPADVVAGTPNVTHVDWGDDIQVFVAGANYASPWKTRGHGGWALGSNIYLRSQGGSKDFRGSDSAGAGTSFDRQQALEPSGSNNAAECAAVPYETYLGCYMRKAVGQTGPPFNDWFNDTTWDAVKLDLNHWSAAVQYLGMTGMVWDLETPDWSATISNGHTEAQNRARVRALFTSIGLTMWTNCPNMVLGIYSFFIQGGWGELSNQMVNAAPYPDTRFLRMDALQGLCDGMRQAGGTGEIDIIDHRWYRTATQTVGSPTVPNRAAFQITSLGGRAQMSTFFDQAVWDYACDKVKLAAFTWRDTDGTAFYDATVPNDAGWSALVLDVHRYSEGSRHYEFLLGESVASGSKWVGSFPNYASATSIAGAQAGASSTALSTVVPTLTSLDATVVAGTVTITCNSGHVYGIDNVKVFTSASAYLGAATMVMNTNGGAITSNYDAAFQACTYTTPGTVGTWYLVKSTSIRGDSTWARVQAHA